MTLKKFLFSQEKLAQIVHDMGERISRDYEGKNLLDGQHPERIGRFYDRSDEVHHHSLQH